MAGSGLRRAPARLPSAGRLLPHGRPAGGDDPRRPRRRPARGGLDRGHGAHGLAQRRPPAAAAQGQRLVQADGDRVRLVPAPRDARRGRRPRRRRGDVRARPAQGRSAAGPEAAARAESRSSSGEHRHERAHAGRDAGRREPRGPADAAGATAEGDRRLPAVDDAAGDRPGAVDQARRRRRLRRSHARARHGQGRGDRVAGLGRPVRGRARRRSCTS